jgi:hypothetical protein
LSYSPSDPTASELVAGITDNDKFENVELMNTSTVDIELQPPVLSGAVDRRVVDTAALANEPRTFFRYAISTEEQICRIEKVASLQRDMAFSIPNFFEMQDFDSIEQNKKSK